MIIKIVYATNNKIVSFIILFVRNYFRSQLCFSIIKKTILSNAKNSASLFQESVR